MTDQTKRPQSSEHIGGRLAMALDLMTWGDETGKPMEWGEAARTVGISARSMRRSLERPAVRRYLLQQKDVLRTCLTAKNTFHLGELVSQRENKAAAVAAARVIENLEDQPLNRPVPGGVTMPGLVITIVNPPLALPATPAPMFDVTPARNRE